MICFHLELNSPKKFDWQNSFLIKESDNITDTIYIDKETRKKIGFVQNLTINYSL